VPSNDKSCQQRLIAKRTLSQQVTRDMIPADLKHSTLAGEARNSQLGNTEDITNKRIALVSSKQLGDVTLLEPMIRLLAERSGNKVALFVKEPFQPLVKLMPCAIWGPETLGCPPFDELWATSWGGKTAMKSWKLSSKKKILLHNRQEHRRWWYRWIFDEFRMESHGLEYWGRYFWRMAGGDVASFKSSTLNQPPAAWRSPLLPGIPYLAIVPTSAWPSKLWSAAQWADLTSQIGGLNLGSTPRDLVMLGGGQEFEKEHCHEIEKLSSGKVHNLCGKTTLKEYLHALAGASALVTVDGSASHLAQAFGRPTVTLFGPTQEQRWHHATALNECLTARHFSADHKNGPASLVPVSSVIEALVRVTQI
jgi:ADP-heptose:LPS heptosyltransferase